MNKTRVLFFGCILAVFGLMYALQGGLSKQPRLQTMATRVNVVASFYPLWYFTSEIGKDAINVTNLTPAGAEPHDWEPTTQDIQKIETSQLVVINGAGLEPWVGKLRGELERHNIQIVSAAENLVNGWAAGDGPLAVRDPHVWLDPVFASQEVDAITRALIAVDQVHRAIYETNSAALQEKLRMLDQDFREGLANCVQKNIVTSHAAFGYLAARYGLTQVAISGLTPDEEPSPKKLAEIADLAKKDKIKFIFFETLVSPRLAQTLAHEVDAQTLVFNPLEGLAQEELNARKDYFTVQRENLANLRIALQCS